MSVPPYGPPGGEPAPEDRPPQSGADQPPAGWGQPGPYGQQPAAPSPSYGPPGGYGQPGGYEQPPPAGHPQGYPPGYGYSQPQTDQKAIWALVVAVAGWLLCPVVLHVVGWVLANQSLRDIRASGGALTGDGMAQAARAVSIIGLVVWGLVLVVVVLIALIGGLASISTA